MAYEPYKLMYVHIPFCASKCFYCDFVSDAVSCNDSWIDDTIDKIILEIRLAMKSGKLAEIETIYVGGGTPSFIGIKRLSSLLHAISSSVDLNTNIEITMEANPESLTAAMIKDVASLGVNRLSIGVQSFDNEILGLLGRPHDAAQAEAAVLMAKEHIKNVSVDVICGIPGQSLKQIETTLQKVINADIQHVSIYPLSIEDHTKFATWVQMGRLSDIDEDQQAQHMQLAADMLFDAGFKRYEIANYAKSGYESKHNIGYWTGKPYIGFGYSAVTMTQNSDRRMRYQFNEVIDDLNKRQKVAEDLMLGMRMSAGISLDAINHAEKLGIPAEKCFNELCAEGFVKKSDRAFIPTERGWLLANQMFEKIFDLEK